MPVRLTVEVVKNLLTETCSLGERYSCGRAGCGRFCGKLLQRILVRSTRKKLLKIKKIDLRSTKLPITGHLLFLLGCLTNALV